MDAIFARDKGDLFPCHPAPKSFYCPTTPVRTQHETTPTNKAAKPSKTTRLPSSHWDMVLPVTMETADLSTSSSSKFNESWPSQSSGGQSATEGVTSRGQSVNEGSVEAVGGTLAKYVDRFRMAPPTNRTARNRPAQSFWWKEDHVIKPTSHVTPPKAPQDHSTPDNTSKTGSYTDPSPRLSSPEGLDTRLQEILDKSSSLLSSGTSLSSAPALKYLNSRGSGKQTVASRLFPDHQPLTKETGCSDYPLTEGAGLSDDILYQWRLKRRLEAARREAVTVAQESCRFNPSVPTSNKFNPSIPSPWDVQSNCRRCITTSHETADGTCTCRKQTPDRKEQSSSLQSASQPELQHRHHNEELQSSQLNIQQLTAQPRTSQLQTQNEPSDPQLTTSKPSQPHSEDTLSPHHPITPSHPHSEPSQPHTTPHNEDTQPHTTHYTPSQPHINEDSSMSDFSLDFTTEIDHTHNDVEVQGQQEQIENVVTEVVEDRLFGETTASQPHSSPPHTASQPHSSTPHTASQPHSSIPHTASQPHSSTPHTASQPHSSTPHTASQPHAPSSHSPPSTPLTIDELTSKTVHCTSSEVPWDCHMGDELLKALVKRAQLFEEQIKTIDGLLATMT